MASFHRQRRREERLRWLPAGLAAARSRDSMSQIHHSEFLLFNRWLREFTSIHPVSNPNASLVNNFLFFFFCKKELGEKLFKYQTAARQRKQKQRYEDTLGVAWKPERFGRAALRDETFEEEAATDATQRRL